MGKFVVPENVIYICQGSKCSKKGSKELCKHLKHYLKQNGLKNEMEVIVTECTDRCKYAPVLSVQPANIWLKEYNIKEVMQLLDKIRK